MSDFVPVSTAAQLLGVSERTVRRWAASGKVPVTAGHRSTLVDLAICRTLTGVAGQIGQVPDSDRQAPADGGQAPDAGLIGLVERLQQQNLELAGRLGYLQAENAQLTARLLLVEGPKPGWISRLRGWLVTAVS